MNTRPAPTPLRPDPYAQRDQAVRAVIKAAIRQTASALESRSAVPPLTLTSRRVCAAPDDRRFFWPR